MDSLVESSPPKICCNRLTFWYFSQFCCSSAWWCPWWCRPPPWCSPPPSSPPALWPAVSTDSWVSTQPGSMDWDHGGGISSTEMKWEPFKVLTCVQNVWTESILWQRKIQWVLPIRILIILFHTKFLILSRDWAWTTFYNRTFYFWIKIYRYISYFV